MCPLYLEGIERILVCAEVIHQLQNLMIEIWINSVMTLLGQFIILGRRDYICLHYIMIYHLCTISSPCPGMFERIRNVHYYCL
jgi:hypothetical protein